MYHNYNLRFVQYEKKEKSVKKAVFENIMKKTDIYTSKIRLADIGEIFKL